MKNSGILLCTHPDRLITHNLMVHLRFKDKLSAIYLVKKIAIWRKSYKQVKQVKHHLLPFNERNTKCSHQLLIFHFFLPHKQKTNNNTCTGTLTHRKIHSCHLHICTHACIVTLSKTFTHTSTSTYKQCIKCYIEKR